MIIEVHRYGLRYVATIAGGWWVAEASTAAEAKRRVIRRFEQEFERHELIGNSPTIPSPTQPLLL